MPGVIEGLKEWARDIVFILVLAGILELLLPSGSTRKYVKVVMGLIVVLVVLNPVLSLVKGSLPVWEDLAVSGLQEPGAPATMPAGTEEAVAAAFAQELQKEIEETAVSLGASSASARVEVGRDSQGRWELSSVHLEVRGTFGWGAKPVEPGELRVYEEQAEEALRRVLEERYGFFPERIGVTFISE
ncbi:MAG: stage III sporulation protein AF [Bacillota bacterium]